MLEKIWFRVEYCTAVRLRSDACTAGDAVWPNLHIVHHVMRRPLQAMLTGRESHWFLLLLLRHEITVQDCSFGPSDTAVSLVVTVTVSLQ
jgi:hypothetical protein